MTILRPFPKRGNGCGLLAVIALMLLAVKLPRNYKRPLPPPPPDWKITGDTIKLGIAQGWLKPVKQKTTNKQHKGNENEN